MKLSVVIPLYNEETKVRQCLETLDGYLKNVCDDYEIVAVNDGSADKTPEIISELKKSMEKLTVVSYDRNRGKGYAVRQGVLASSGDGVAYTDCDLAYGKEAAAEIDAFRRQNSCDVAIGSRNLNKDSYAGYTFLRKVLSKGYIKLIRLLSGFSHSDSQCGLKAFDGEVARKVFSECTVDGFAFDLEALLECEKYGYSICEMPVVIKHNANSESKVDPIKDSLKMLKDVRRIRKNEKKQK